MSPSKRRRRMKKKNKKKNKKSLTVESTLDLSLPDDLLLSCFARVSRLYYPTLSLVSKRFRSLLTSPELYKARSLLGHTENCLYVCLDDKSYYKTKWFTLCRKPDGLQSKNDNSSGYVLARALIPHSPVNSYGCGLMACGSSIYNICGSRSSSTFSILDCTTHTWRKAPRYCVKLGSITASLVDRKIYVAGCYKDGDTGSYKNSIEVFDTETQIWDHLPIPCCETDDYYYKSACIDGKFQLETNREVFAYNSKEGIWDLVRLRTYQDMSSYHGYEIENVLYSVNFYGVFRWFDTKASVWRDLKGLEGLPKLTDDAHSRLADYGGNLVVFWEKKFPFDSRSQVHQKMIWCAEIELERRNSCEIWGKVLWLDICGYSPSSISFGECSCCYCLMNNCSHRELKLVFFL